MSKLFVSKLALFALHGGICGSFHKKATIHASSLHCELGRRQFWHSLQKLLLSNHPWPNMNNHCTIWEKIRCYHPLTTISWFFFHFERFRIESWFPVFKTHIVLSYKISKQPTGGKGLVVSSLTKEGDISLSSSLTNLHTCVYIYTERQKKLITSSECHSLKSKASTWIIFRHRLGIFILNKHI